MMAFRWRHAVGQAYHPSGEIRWFSFRFLTYTGTGSGG